MQHVLNQNRQLFRSTQQRNPHTEPEQNRTLATLQETMQPTHSIKAAEINPHIHSEQNRTHATCHETKQPTHSFTVAEENPHNDPDKTVHAKQAMTQNSQLIRSTQQRKPTLRPGEKP